MTQLKDPKKEAPKEANDSNPSIATGSIKLKVGVFTLLGLSIIGAVTIFVNDRPFWWRSCQLVTINVEDATGLKAKSPVRSLGIQVGYLKSIDLSETHVALGICLTAPVEVLPSTRAYIRSEGFLGDKFVELKPMRYKGGPVGVESSFLNRLSLIETAQAEEVPVASSSPSSSPVAPSAPPSPPSKPKKRSDSSTSREIPVGEGNQDMQQLVGRVDGLVQEMTSLTSNLKQAINPEELRSTMRQLNKTLENASRTLAPEGGLNQTAQRVLAKLEDAVDQLRDQLTRINQGKGSLGMLLNDPAFAEEIREALKNANKLLNKVSHVRFVVDVGGEEITGYKGGRGWFRLGIWPTESRYYLIGIGVDPRGRRTDETITTVAGGQTSVVQTTRVETTGILVTGMLGTVLFRRIDLSIGALFGDGTVRLGLNLGPSFNEDRVQIFNDVYTHSGEQGMDYRVTAMIKPFSILYARGGIESLHRVNGSLPWIFGGGVSFDDDDIKLLFAFK